MLTRPEAQSPPAPVSLALPPAAYNSIGWTKGVQWSQIVREGWSPGPLVRKGHHGSPGKCAACGRMAVGGGDSPRGPSG